MQKSRAATAVPFGKVLRIRRKKAGVTQEQLAQDCDLHPTYVSMLERGLRHPSLDTVFLIAERLGIRASQLVADVEKAMRRGGDKN